MSVRFGEDRHTVSLLLWAIVEQEIKRLITTRELYGAVSHKPAMKLPFDRLQQSRWIELATVDCY